MVDRERKTITTYAEREEIFAKDYLTIADIQKLLGMTYENASAKMSAIKAVTGDRLKMKGKLHVQDYLEYFNLPNSERYSRTVKEEYSDD